MKKIFLLIFVVILSQYSYSQKLSNLIDSATNYKNAQIKTNGINAITGQIMNTALQKIIDALHYIDSATTGITTDSIQVQYPLAIEVQNGIKTFLLKNYVDSITVVDDSDYWWSAGTPHLIGARNSGSGGIGDSTFRIYKQINGDSVFYVKNGVPLFAFKDSSYSPPLLHQYSVPYAGSDGKLTEDNANFNYNGNLTVGNGGFYSSTGLRLNGGRATLTASGWGAQFSTQGGLPADASKSITFYNSQRPYLTMYMPNTSPSTTPMEGEAYMHWWPAITDSFELGHPTKEWKNAYIKNLYINGALFNPNLSGTYIPLSDKAANNGVATLDNSGKVPLSQLPALTLNQPVYVQTISEMLSSSANVADIYVVGDSSKSYALMTEPASTLSDWLELQSPIPTNTDLLPEGSTNKYYTDIRARNAVGVTGTGLSYDPVTGLFSNTRKPDWDAVPGSDNEILNKPDIPVEFQPLGSKNIRIDSTYPNLVFSVQEMYDSIQVDSITNQLRTEITAAAGGGVTSFGTNNRVGAVVPQVGDYSSFYQLLENQRLSTTNDVHFNSITSTNGTDSTQITNNHIQVFEAGGFSALSNNGTGGLLTLQNRNGFHAELSTNGLTTTQLLNFPNAPNGQVGNIIPVSVNNVFADSTGNITLTQSNVGLSNVDNTSDISKPISTATQNALNNKVAYADTANMLSPYEKIIDAFTKSQADALYKPITYVPTWNEITGKPTINGYSLNSNITLGKSDIGLSNVDNTSDISKPVSTAVQTALNLKMNYTDSVAMLAHYARSTDAILNQQASKESKVSWYKKSILDTLTNQSAPTSPQMFDYRSGSYLFQFDGKRIILSNNNEGLHIGTNAGLNYEGNLGNTNVGFDAGFLGNGTQNAFFGDRTGMYVVGSNNSAFNRTSLYTFVGSGTSAYGVSSGYYSNGQNLTFLGYFSGYRANSDSSTFVGVKAGQTFDFTYTVSSSSGHNVTYSSIACQSWAGTNVASMITAGNLTVGSVYPFNITYLPTYPQISGVNQLGVEGKIAVVASDSIIIIGQSNYTTFGTGSFTISLTTKRVVNAQVFGNAATADSSNQVVLGNSSITQQKWGGSGNIRWATNITPSNGQVPAWDATTGQYKPATVASGGVTNYDTVTTTTQLIAYNRAANSVYVTDTLQGGLFLYMSGTKLADYGVVFPATGKGTGYWIRLYDKTKGVNVDWWGSRDNFSIIKAVNFIGAAGTINFTPQRTYTAYDEVVPLEGQIFNGNNATYKRANDSIVTTLAARAITDSFVTVSATLPNIAAFQYIQLFYDTTAAGSSSILAIKRISAAGDTIFFKTPIGANGGTSYDPTAPNITTWPVGTSVRKVFAMFNDPYVNTNYSVYNLIMDGNKVSTGKNRYWAVNNAIVLHGSQGLSTIDHCSFYNMPNENIMGQGIRVTNNTAKQLNGSFVHLSAGYLDRPLSGQTFINNNFTDSTNWSSDLVSGHDEGVITYSVTPGYYNIENNRFNNGMYGGAFGVISYTSSTNDGGNREGIISNNYCKNFTGIFTPIPSLINTSYLKPGHLTIAGNTFDHCGANDWTPIQSALDNYADTIIIGSNTLVGGTTWKIPVQKWDTLQRYVLNNPTSTPQGADINISGNAKFRTQATTDSSNNGATTAFVKQIKATISGSGTTLNGTGLVRMNGTTVSYDNTAYAPLASPALTGVPTAPTPTTTDSSTKIATTAFVKQVPIQANQITGIIDTSHLPPQNLSLTYPLVQTSTLHISQTYLDSIFASGVYTPILTGITNYSSSIVRTAQWMKVGKTVTVSGEVLLKAAATGLTTVSLTLPVASTFGSSYDAAGTGAGIGFGTMYNYVVIGRSGTQTVAISFIADTNATTGQVDCVYHYTYQIE